MNVSINFSFFYARRSLTDDNYIVLFRTVESLDLYILTEDRVEGPVKIYVYLAKVSIFLSNNALKNALH